MSATIKTTNGIYNAILGVMTEIGAIGKNSKNQQQGFMYRGVDAVMNALQPALTNNKIFVVPEVLEQTREERTTKTGGTLLYSILKMKYSFYATDGSSVSAVVVGEGMDSGDKASNKAMSVAFKYACFQVFCIPTEEMVDPDEGTPPQSTPKGQKQKQVNPPTKEQLKQAAELNIIIENVAVAYKTTVDNLTAEHLADAIKRKTEALKKQAAKEVTQDKGSSLGREVGENG